MISQGSIAWQELPDSIERDDFFYFNYDSRNFLLSDVALEKAFLTGKFELLLSRNFKYLKLTYKLNKFILIHFIFRRRSVLQQRSKNVLADFREKY